MVSVAQTVEQWPVGRLRPNPLNVRRSLDSNTIQELASSIREHGVLQPLLCCPDGLIVAGHRRHAAAQHAGIPTVPVLVRQLSELDQLAVIMTENLQRADLTPVEEARGYHEMRERGLSHQEIGRRLGVSGRRVSEHLLLLELDPLAQELFGRRELPVTLVRHLAKIVDPAHQRRVASLVAKRLLTVLDVRKLVEDVPEVTKPVGPSARESRTPQTVSRVVAVKAIRDHPFPAVPTAKLDAAMEGACSVCSSCGCKDIEVICAACPLPTFVVRVLG